MNEEVEPIDTEAIDRIGIATVRQLIAERDAANSGGDVYYEQRVSAGSLFASYERELLRILVQRRREFESCYTIGAGAGILTITLAAQGIATVGIESDPKRFGLASAIVKKVEEQGLINAPCRFVHARYPDIEASEGMGRNMALMTNVTTTISDGDRDVFVRSLLGFKYILIDLGHFLRPAPDRADQHALLQELLAIGFRKPEMLFSPDARTAYCLFEGLGASRKEPYRQDDLVA